MFDTNEKAFSYSGSTGYATTGPVMSYSQGAEIASTHKTPCDVMVQVHSINKLIAELEWKLREVIVQEPNKESDTQQTGLKTTLLTELQIMRQRILSLLNRIDI